MRKIQMGYTLSELLVLLFALAIFCGVIYIAFHFLSKFW